MDKFKHCSIVYQNGILRAFIMQNYFNEFLNFECRKNAKYLHLLGIFPNSSGEKLCSSVILALSSSEILLVIARTLSWTSSASRRASVETFKVSRPITLMTGSLAKKLKLDKWHYWKTFSWGLKEDLFYFFSKIVFLFQKFLFSLYSYYVFLILTWSTTSWTQKSGTLFN